MIIYASQKKKSVLLGHLAYTPSILLHRGLGKYGSVLAKQAKGCMVLSYYYCIRVCTCMVRSMSLVWCLCRHSATMDVWVCGGVLKLKPASSSFSLLIGERSESHTNEFFYIHRDFPHIEIPPIYVLCGSHDAEYYECFVITTLLPAVLSYRVTK